MEKKTKGIIMEKEADDHAKEENEDLQDWRNVIFYPFGSIWKAVLVGSVCTSCFIASYQLSYAVNAESKQIHNIIFYTCEFFYFIDTMICIMHR